MIYHTTTPASIQFCFTKSLGRLSSSHWLCCPLRPEFIEGSGPTMLGCIEDSQKSLFWLSSSHWLCCPLRPEFIEGSSPTILGCIEDNQKFTRPAPNFTLVLIYFLDDRVAQLCWGVSKNHWVGSQYSQWIRCPRYNFVPLRFTKSLGQR